MNKLIISDYIWGLGCAMAQVWDNLKESCSYYAGPWMELRSSGLAFSAFTFLPWVTFQAWTQALFSTQPC